jgi:hypothetical protein
MSNWGDNDLGLEPKNVGEVMYLALPNYMAM